MSDTVVKAAARLRDVQATMAMRAEFAAREMGSALDDLVVAARAAEEATEVPVVDVGSNRLGPVSTSGTGNPFHPGGVVWGAGNPGGGDAVAAGVEGLGMVAPDPLRAVRNAAHDAVLAGVLPGHVHDAVNEGVQKAKAARRELAVKARIRERLRRFDPEVPAAVADAMADDLAAVARELHREGLLDG
jgi:hypothetical protein